MSDGTVITFDKGEGKTAPAYYTATNGIRVYANGIVTITATGKKIAKAVLECDSYSGTDYVGNDTMTLN